MSHPADEESFHAAQSAKPAPRMLPASDIGERGVICSFMLAPEQVHAICQERDITKAHFHNPALGIIFRVLVDLMDAPKPPDVVMLTQTLSDQGLLESVGGPAAVSELYTFLPTALNIRHYLDLMESKLTLRGIIAICAEFQERAHTEQDNEQLLAELHKAVTELTLKGVREERTFKQILIATPTRWEETKETGGMQLLTGFQRLDTISPIRRKHTVVISGREKSGKSALAGNIVLNTAHKNKVPTLVFPLEMPSEEWIDRLLSEHGSLSQRNIHAGTLTKEEEQRAAVSISELSTAPIDIYDSYLTLPKIIAKMRQWKAKHPSGGLVVIDYLQLIETAFVKGRNREQEIALMSKTLRNVGKELDVALIELCQVNNEGESRDSKAIQQDCTAFWQVLHELDDKGNAKNDNIRTLHVKFQRHGPRNVRIPFHFYGDVMSFREDNEPAPEPTLFEDRTKRRSQTPDD